jgi:thioredoxin 1
MATVSITSKSFDSILKSSGIVLIDWWADWCGPCRAFAPIYERVSARHPDLVFGKVDTEAEPSLAQAYQIRAIPTLMIIRDGLLVFSQPGMVPEKMLEGMIERVRALDMSVVHRESAQARDGHRIPA